MGSYTKPEWLTRCDATFRLDGSNSQVPPGVLAAAKRDAALLAIYEQERAGLGLLTDGEAQRPAYDHHHFYARLGGVDASRPVALEAMPNLVSTALVDDDCADELHEQLTQRPRIVGPLARPGPLSVDEVRFARQHTTRPLKTTVIGRLTAYAKMSDEHYPDAATGMLALADVMNQEMRVVQEEGVALIQVDEPGIHSRLTDATEHVPRLFERMTAGIVTPVAVHLCYGYAYFHSRKSLNVAYAEALDLAASLPGVSAVSLEYEQPRHGPSILRHCCDKHVILGLLNLGTQDVETPEHIAARIRGALDVIPPERLHPSSDCGMWHLPRELAFGKIRALVQGTDIIRRELGMLAV